MAFLVFYLTVTFLIQIVVLSVTNKLVIRLLPLIFMELLPMGGVAYYGIKKPSGFIFDDWIYNFLFCLWLTGAVLLGYILAWIVYKLRSKK